MKIAVVGATGLVGRKIINLCEKYFASDVNYSFLHQVNLLDLN